MHFDKDVILTAGRGRVLEILREVAGIPAEYLDGKHHPCPLCGGKDRFRLIDKQAGAVYCNQCFSEQNGDFIAAVQWARDVSFDESLSLIGEFLGVTDAGTHPAERRASQSPGRDSAKPAAVYDYPDADGNPAYRVERYEYTKDGKRKKDFFQCSYRNGTWVRGLFDTPGATIPTPKRIPYPYNFSRLMESEVKTLFIVEGEKCVERLQAVLNAVEQSEQYAVSTLAGGSNMMRFWGDHADRLLGLKVFIIPDNDKSGTDGASAAVDSLDASGIEASVIPFEDKPEKYDVADWIDERRAAGRTDREIGEEFLNTFPAKGKGGIEWVDGLNESETESETKLEFPIECFPPGFREYCVEVARVCCVDLSFPSYMLLSVASLACEYRLRFSCWEYRNQRAFFHSLLVAHSGAGKTPVLDNMMFPIEEHDEDIRRKNQTEWERYERETAGKSKKEIKGVLPPTYRQPTIIFKPTFEKVEGILYEIWKSCPLDEMKPGICLKYDEATSLLFGMDSYKNNNSKTDLATLIPLLDGKGGGSERVDETKSRYYSSSHVIIVGGIQDDLLRQAVRDKPEFFNQGFLQRLSFAVPGFTPKTVLPKPIDETTRKTYRILVNRLYKFSGDLELSEQARRRYRDYVRQTTDSYNARGGLGENRTAADNIKLSAERKGEKKVLEIAALLTALKCVEDGAERGEIDAAEMDGAIKIMEFVGENFDRMMKLCLSSNNNQSLEQKIEMEIKQAGEKGLTQRDLNRRFFTRQKKEVVAEFMAGVMRQNPKIKQKTIIRGNRPSVVYYSV